VGQVLYSISMTSRPNGRSSTVPALLALWLVAASTVAPALHGRFDRLSAAHAVEAHHTQQCPTIHVDALCPTCQAADIARGTMAARVPHDDAAESLRPATAAGRLPKASRDRLHDPVRAPPIA